MTANRKCQPNIQKTEVFIKMSIPESNKMGQLRSCEDIMSVA